MTEPPGPPVADLGKPGKLNIQTIQSAKESYEDVLLYAGALPHDAMSARMVQETKSGTGRQGYTGNLDADRARLKSTIKVKDTDRDGIPDAWEEAGGLNPSEPADASKHARSGYTNLERYCHERAGQLIDAAKNRPER